METWILDCSKPERRVPYPIQYKAEDTPEECFYGDCVVHKHSDSRALFRDLLSQRSITPLLAKLAHDALEVFYATEMLPRA